MFGNSTSVHYTDTGYNTANPLFFNTEEIKGANSVAMSYWLLQMAFHWYVLPKILIGTYDKVNKMRNGAAKDTPAEPGFIAWAALWLGSWALSFTAKDKYVDNHLWSYLAPTYHSFMHPIMMRFNTNLAFLNQGNPGIALRDLVPGGEGSWLTWLLTPVYGVRNFWNNTVVDHLSAPQKTIDNANLVGRSVADTGATLIKIISDFSKVPEKIGPCLYTPQEAAACYAQASSYGQVQFGQVWKSSQPFRQAMVEFAGAWGHWAAENAKYFSTDIMRHADNGLQQLATILAQKAEVSQESAKIAVYGAVGCLTTYLAYKAVNAGISLATEAAKRAWLPAQHVVVRHQ